MALPFTESLHTHVGGGSVTSHLNCSRLPASFPHEKQRRLGNCTLFSFWMGMVTDPIITAATCISGHLSVHWSRSLNGYSVEDHDGFMQRTPYCQSNGMCV